MKPKFDAFRILATLTCMTLVTVACDPSDGSVPRLEDKLGADLRAILSEPDRTASFHVAGQTTDNGRYAGHEVTREGAELTSDQLEAFQDIVLSEDSYILHATKKCVFLPDYAVEAQQAEAIVTVLIAPDCKQFLFLHNDTRTIIDYDPATEAVRAFTDDLFHKE